MSYLLNSYSKQLGNGMSLEYPLAAANYRRY